MSLPAGWYDDGSGRQRWWDGSRWTDDFAQEQSVAGYQPGSPVVAAVSAPTKATPVLGFVGLGLAVVGTVLACIPPSFVFGAVVLFAAFVVSLIGIFKKGVAKWPSIVGVALSIIGAVVGTIIFIAALALAFGFSAGGIGSSAEPSTTTTTQPADPTPDASARDRPSVEVIATEYAATLHASGMTMYDDVPDFYPCVAQILFDSDVSDESLWLVISGADPLPEERELAGQAIIDATLACDPQPTDP